MTADDRSLLTRLWPIWVAIVLLVVALAAGHRAFAGRIYSYADDLTTYGPSVWPTTPQYVREAYTTLNGRLTSHLTSAMVRLVIPPARFTPESYPWWAIFAMTWFLGGIAAVALAFAVQQSAELTAGAAFLIAVIAVVGWGSAPALFETSLYAVCIGFVAGACALGVGAAGAASLRPGAWRLVSAAVLFAYAALCSEQLMTSTIVVFSTITVVLALSRRLSLRQAVVDIALWLALTALSFAVYFGSPGQRKRNPSVGVAFGGLSELRDRIPRWLTDSVREEYAVLFGSSRFAVLVHCCLFAAAVALLFATWRRRDAASRLALIAVGFGAAFHASLLHLLFSPHFPGGRSRFYPALLLVFFLITTIAALARFADDGAFARRLSAVAVLGVFVMAALHGSEIRRLYRQAVWTSNVRQDVRAELLARCRTTNAKNFRLVGWPMDIDAPWGFKAYLAWRGYPGMAVIAPGLTLGSPELDRAAMPVPSKRIPPLLDDSSTSTNLLYSPDPVRTVIYPGPTLFDFASWDTDFRVTPKASVCRIVGIYNPNAGGDYRESFEYHVFVGRAWENNQVVAVIEPRLIGSVKRSTVEISIAWTHDGQLGASVPVTTFDEKDPEHRPYLRVTVSRAIIAYGAWVSDIRLRCE